MAQVTIFQDACVQPLINHPSDDTAASPASTRKVISIWSLAMT
jgi:hypothetical protein